MRRSGAMKRLNVLLSASPAWVLKNFNSPASCASMSIASILPRNRRASTLTWTRKLEREAIHRALSSESPPPGTIGERRAPGVQHGRDTDPCAEALGISGDSERRLRRCLHQQVVEHALVLVGDVTQLARQRIDDVKVWYRQELRLAVCQPSA